MQAWMNIFQEVACVWSNGQTKPGRILPLQIFTLIYAWSIRRRQPQNRLAHHTSWSLIGKFFAAPPVHVAVYA